MTPKAKRNPLRDDMAGKAFVVTQALCKELAPLDLDKLFATGSVLDAVPGDVIVEQDATDDTMYMIVEGTVSVRVARGAEQQEVATLERPALFGEMAVLTRAPRRASVVAVTDARLIELPGSAVREVAESSEKFGRRLAMLMAARGKDLEKKTGG